MYHVSIQSALVIISDGQGQPDLSLHMAAKVLRPVMSAHERPVSHDSQLMSSVLRSGKDRRDGRSESKFRSK